MKHKSAELISVIVPVYNVERYLPDCLLSLRSQTYPSLEILLVDDGSSDQSGAICDELASDDPRFRVIHKKNGGLSDARNTGLNAASGTWICFVDGDDVVAPDCMEYLHHMTLKIEKPDVASVALQPFFENERPSFPSQENSEVHVYSRNEAMKNLCYNRTLTNSVCGKLFYHALFREVRFPLGRYYEDLGTFYLLIHQSSGVAVSSYPAYGYLQRQGSILHQKMTDRHLDGVLLSQEMSRFYQEHYPEYQKDSEVRVFMSAFDVFLKCDLSDAEERKVAMKAWDIIKPRRIICLGESNAGIDYRLLSAASFLGFTFTHWLWHLWLRIKSRGACEK